MTRLQFLLLMTGLPLMTRLQSLLLVTGLLIPALLKTALCLGRKRNSLPLHFVVIVVGSFWMMFRLAPRPLRLMNPSSLHWTLLRKNSLNTIFPLVLCHLDPRLCLLPQQLLLKLLLSRPLLLPNPTRYLLLQAKLRWILLPRSLLARRQ